jgi:hypothetical protein
MEGLYVATVIASAFISPEVQCCCSVSSFDRQWYEQIGGMHRDMS